jgi:ABC-2 type transport system permease protein
MRQILIANTITNYVNAILQNRAQEINNKPASLSNTNPNSIVLQSELKSVFTFVPGVTVILMLVSAMMTSISITVKRIGYHGSIARLPFKPLQVILGKVFPYIFLSMINAT